MVKHTFVFKAFLHVIMATSDPVCRMTEAVLIIILFPSQLAALESCHREKRGGLLPETTCRPRKVAKTGGRFLCSRTSRFSRATTPFFFFRFFLLLQKYSYHLNYSTWCRISTRSLNVFYWDFLMYQHIVVETCCSKFFLFFILFNLVDVRVI